MEPELEQEVLEQEPTEEVVEETPVEAVQEPEPTNIRTGGRWKKLAECVNTEFENGKTYRVSIKGTCQFMLSQKRPSFGIETNEITFTKEEGIEAWIKTKM